MDKQQQIAHVLQAMFDAGGGRLTAEQVVEAAKEPDSPLHDQFIWDDAKAAHRQRLDTGRQLIRSVRTEITKNMTVIHAPIYVRDPDLNAKDQGYVDVRSSQTSADAKRNILIAEFKRVAGVFARAADLAVLFELEDELKVMQTRLKVMVSELSDGGRA